ncbi:hypothetical protein PROFUN_05558 [Planoprotostelium fungivorum]|uniref:Uncharacterized protein n=1 Tax=Planoprotostelium fungivorum TaxID=1890364 RepID=A0A2P6N048_9EUKA|nr:hypothetical protein PROFUN_05558 [Planoprotostelium fungivorum]
MAQSVARSAVNRKVPGSSPATWHVQLLSGLTALTLPSLQVWVFG